MREYLEVDGAFFVPWWALKTLPAAERADFLDKAEKVCEVRYDARCNGYKMRFR